MAFVQVQCPDCHRTDVVQYGKQANGTQRYRCNNRDGCLVNSRYGIPIFILRDVPAPGTWQFCRKFSFEAIWGMLSLSNLE